MFSWIRNYFKEKRKREAVEARRDKALDLVNELHKRVSDTVYNFLCEKIHRTNIRYTVSMDFDSLTITEDYDGADFKIVIDFINMPLDEKEPE